MESTGIGWTDGTVNFWIGCTPVGPGCDHCYAAVLALKRWGIKFETGGERRPTQYAWTDPLKWNRFHCEGVTHMKLGKNRDGSPKIIPVPIWIFCQSLADFLDNEADPELRKRAWAVIKGTPRLRWQIVSKRIGNALDMLPEDWGDGSDYQHVGFVATVVTQAEADRDIHKLLELKRHGVKWVGLSIEPQLGLIDLTWVKMNRRGTKFANVLTGTMYETSADGQVFVVGPCPNVDWVIGGGESKQGEGEPREYDLMWGSKLIRDCDAADVPYFEKQTGHRATYNGVPCGFKGKGDKPEEWPAWLNVRQMPRVYDFAA